jgi:hypothetical protein
MGIRARWSVQGRSVGRLMHAAGARRKTGVASISGNEKADWPMNAGGSSVCGCGRHVQPSAGRLSCCSPPSLPPSLLHAAEDITLSIHQVVCLNSGTRAAIRCTKGSSKGRIKDRQTPDCSTPECPHACAYTGDRRISVYSSMPPYSNHSLPCTCSMQLDQRSSDGLLQVPSIDAGDRSMPR